MNKFHFEVTCILCCSRKTDTLFVQLSLVWVLNCWSHALRAHSFLSCSCFCVRVLQGTPEFVAVSQCVHYFEWRTYAACKSDRFKPHKEVGGGTSDGRLSRWREGFVCVRGKKKSPDTVAVEVWFIRNDEETHHLQHVFIGVEDVSHAVTVLMRA